MVIFIFFGDRPLLRKLDVRLSERQPELLLKALRNLHVPFPNSPSLSSAKTLPHTPCFESYRRHLILYDAQSCMLTSIFFFGHLAFDLVLPHLEYLKLVSCSLEMLTQLLRHITPPSLLYLSVMCDFIKPDVLSSEVLAFVNRSSCHLTHITIRGDLGPSLTCVH